MNQISFKAHFALVIKNSCSIAFRQRKQYSINYSSSINFASFDDDDEKKNFVKHLATNKPFNHVAYKGMLGIFYHSNTLFVVNNNTYWNRKYFKFACNSTFKLCFMRVQCRQTDTFVLVFRYFFLSFLLSKLNSFNGFNYPIWLYSKLVKIVGGRVIV